MLQRKIRTIAGALLMAVLALSACDAKPNAGQTEERGTISNASPQIGTKDGDQEQDDIAVVVCTEQSLNGECDQRLPLDSPDLFRVSDGRFVDNITSIKTLDHAMCFYTEPLHTGIQFTVPANTEVSNLGDGSFGDVDNHIRSFAPAPCSTVVVCDEPQLGGQCYEHLPISMPELFSFGIDFNDKTTSLQTLETGMCFYTDLNYKGRAFEVLPGKEIADLSESLPKFNDSISSYGPAPCSTESEITVE
ncbi:hypothetical protein [Streptomyces rishiriensis]|uniref:Lipoprotein n=1 Tax=Streptomyces rishiriensis TaxID=68264 RepID=A0ABU0NGA5_STRRH|nr:hypothetical protein [Streptomyces rishiriensis]MDQ0578139.1 hypothetical protein [Streptomyces rishiriensis]